MATTTTLKCTSGKRFDWNTAELQQLEKEAIQAYNDSMEYETLTRGKSEASKWKLEIKLQKEGKLKFGTIFQVTKKYLSISYKRNLLNGVFKGYSFQMQVLESFNDVPAGTILKW